MNTDKISRTIDGNSKNSNNFSAEGNVQVALLPLLPAAVITYGVPLATFVALNLDKIEMLIEVIDDAYTLYEHWKEIFQTGKEIFQTVKEHTTKTITIEDTDTGYTVVTERLKGLGRQIEIEKIDKAFAPSDASQLAQRTAQQMLTPVKVEFRQEYDLLFTQSADSLGSRYGSHSGTITNGTRFNISGDSRAGDFTGSITNGRTVAEPGYTPATHNNTSGSGTSVGTVSAKGFKEGELKGNMTITIPAGVQALTVSGNITISKDGSLSMPSYSGPVTDNATGAKVGTMTGMWNQGPTR